VNSDFDEFFVRMFPRAVNLAKRVTGDNDAAQDVAIEALARAYSRWGRVGTLPWRDGWVLRVCFHEALHALPRGSVPLISGSTSDHSEVVVLRDALRAALARLPRRQRDALALRYLADLSEEDVAALLGVSRGSVKTHVHRGLRKLRSDARELLVEVDNDH
jgi:RNA polymerase sigma factor (sigma-70 family)